VVTVQYSRCRLASDMGNDGLVKAAGRIESQDLLNETDAQCEFGPLRRTVHASPYRCPPLPLARTRLLPLTSGARA
jgi:hypothetical protein